MANSLKHAYLDALELEADFDTDTRDAQPKGLLVHCVQCATDFDSDDNQPGLCRFHAEDDGKCCLRGNIPCSASMHRTEHHTEYPYASYNTYIKSFFAHDHQVFGTAQSDDVSINPVITLSVSCGVTSHTHPSSVDKLFLFFKTGREANQQLLMLYGREELLGDASLLDPLVKRIEVGDNVVQAKWISEGEEIRGVELLAKSASSQTPAITKVLFEYTKWSDPSPTLKDVQVVSVSRFGELAPPEGATYGSVPHGTVTFLYQKPGSKLLGVPRPRPPQLFQNVGNAAVKLDFVSVDCFRSNKAARGGDQFLIVLDVDKVNVEAMQIVAVHCWWMLRDESGASVWQEAKIYEEGLSGSDGVGIGRLGTLKLFVETGESGVARRGPVLFDGESYIDWV
ncbi:hypothetical protein HDU99_005338 [Rhizoclosmatium hyalinum]|nr:hypothetical protein HDU99_005338 [Rhizoclosmatium hyalinum]